ncbi:MAG: BREX-1 system adenine-specific DNA-methyltransferase PglX [Gemmatimonadota bacterium]|nr:BREX-1 system adenine-specific DNA-methyltransferase PglX [Gemmatimonadota bacterium]
MGVGRLNDLLDGRIPSADPQGEVYRQLVLAACRFYHSLLPDLFERLDDETELLLPDDLLTEHSVVQGFRTEITDEDCAEVELLGWLYQFYISEKKDAVMARKSAVPSEDIPAVTQLFTPHWIVRYLVENSLGRLWLLNRPTSRLREQMPYYIEGEAETDFLKIARPEEIRLIDPAVGSGHMLTYAFDLLYAIYEEEGYAPSEIPGLILKHNLYGVDIDPRAAQLASLALALKAREKSHRFFQPDQLVQPHVIALQDVRFEERELGEYVRALDLGELFDQPVLDLLRQFEEATTFGSLIQPVLGERQIQQLRRQIEAKELGGELFLSETHGNVLRVLEQAAYLTQRYQIAVANPPYMGNKAMSARVKAYLDQELQLGRQDLFAAFMQRLILLPAASGYVGMITMHGWMFLKTYEDLRRRLLQSVSFRSLAHLGPRAFDSISGEVVQTAGFVFSTLNSVKGNVEFVRTTDGRSERHKEQIFLRSTSSGSSRFTIAQSELEEMPGQAFLYWLPRELRRTIRDSPRLGDVAKPRQGLATADNATFLRAWTEVSSVSIGMGVDSRAASKASKCRWFPYNKGGPFRKWYGNNDFVVDWENDGRRIFAFRPKAVVRNPDFYFKAGITWTDISPGAFGARLQPPGFIFDVSGSCVFSDNAEDTDLLLAYFASKPVFETLSAFNPTLHFQVGNIADLPYPSNIPAAACGALRVIARTAVAIAREDWDNYETSWDFRDLPLLRSSAKGDALAERWQDWQSQCDTAISRMQELETENNRVFIEGFGLQGEFSPNVAKEQITLARADPRRDMAAFLSYAVGCMMGRYSLDSPGLILADAGDTLPNYLAKVGKPLDQLTFAPDEDAIIPVLDGEWFEDDIVARARDFLRATFGEATLRENLRFIEESLGRDLRKYFLSDFYKDHLQTYKKRPIYWMVQSPRKGFSVLIYLHRYTRDTINQVLNRYLREYQAKLRDRLSHLAREQASEGLSARDRTAARKEADRLIRVLHECEEWERQTLLPLAQARIELDLDDGVKVNYLKLGEALAPIPGLAAKSED